MKVKEFEPEFRGYCIHCNKKIYTFDNPEYNWLDEAAVIQNNSGLIQITGGYGSRTMDCCIAHFTDYELEEKCNKLFSSMSSSRDFLYICDDCIEKLIKENKIYYIIEDNYSSSKNRLREKYFPYLEEKNFYVSIPRVVFAYKFNDYSPEYIVNQMNKYYSFIHHIYSIKYNSDKNRIEITQNEKIIKTFTSGEVLIIHDYTDFEILSEIEFNKRYTFYKSNMKYEMFY